MTPGTLELQYMTPDQATHTRYVPTKKGNITNQKKKRKKKKKTKKKKKKIKKKQKKENKKRKKKT